MRRLVPCDGGGVGGSVDNCQVGNFMCGICKEEYSLIGVNKEVFTGETTSTYYVFSITPNGV